MMWKRLVLVSMSLIVCAAPVHAAGTVIFVPQVVGMGGCAPVSGEVYGTIDIDGPYYKDNHLTDENADLRLSVLGYTAPAAAVDLVDYGGATDPDAPQFTAMFEPGTAPVFAAAHRRYDWKWDEGGLPPYGVRSGVNDDWPVSVLEMHVMRGTAIRPPGRTPQIGGGFVAMVLYAGERELTLAYFRQDGVGSGYVVYLSGLCVDAALTAAYQAQLFNGRRVTGKLPAAVSGQTLGVADGGTVVVAVRDRGTFLDPRSRKDWWGRRAESE